MAPAEVRFARPERRWDCRRGTPRRHVDDLRENYASNAWGRGQVRVLREPRLKTLASRSRWPQGLNIPALYSRQSSIFTPSTLSRYCVGRDVKHYSTNH